MVQDWRKVAQKRKAAPKKKSASRRSKSKAKAKTKAKAKASPKPLPAKERDEDLYGKINQLEETMKKFEEFTATPPPRSYNPSVSIFKTESEKSASKGPVAMRPEPVSELKGDVISLKSELTNLSKKLENIQSGTALPSVATTIKPEPELASKQARLEERVEAIAKDVEKADVNKATCSDEADEGTICHRLLVLEQKLTELTTQEGAFSSSIRQGPACAVTTGAVPLFVTNRLSDRPKFAKPTVEAEAKTS